MSKKAFVVNKLIHDSHHYQNNCNYLSQQNQHLKREVERLRNEIRVLRTTCTIYPHNRDFNMGMGMDMGMGMGMGMDMDPSNCVVSKTEVQDVTNEFVMAPIPPPEPVMDSSRCFTYPSEWALYNNYLNPYHNPYNGYPYNGFPYNGYPYNGL